MRAALEWCFDQGNNPHLGAQIAERLWVYWYYSLQEGRRWLEVARANMTPENDLALSVGIDLTLSRVLINFSAESATAACERALAGARLLGEQRTLARAVFYMGENQLYTNRFEEAEACLNEARDLAHRVGDDYREASALHVLAGLYLDTKRFDDAREHMAASMRFYEKQRVERNRGLALVTEAGIERAVGDFRTAIELTREAQSIGEALHDSSLEMIGQASTAVCLIGAERYDEAKTSVRAALVLSRDVRIVEGWLRLFIRAWRWLSMIDTLNKRRGFLVTLTKP